jgi:dUTP pyrophosphatase
MGTLSVIRRAVRGMFRAGSFVAEHVAPTTPAQVQPNGVDLTLDAVFEQRDPGRIGRDGKEIGERQALDPAQVGSGDGTGGGDEQAAVGEEQAAVGDEQASHGDEQASHGDEQASHGDEQASHGDEQARHGDEQAGAGTYYLEPGAYVVRYGERLRIPEGHVGFVYPRSSLMRNSCMLNSAVWDAGYEGRGEGLLQVHHDIELEEGARIAQIVYAEADHDDAYDGDYQGENL